MCARACYWDPIWKFFLCDFFKRDLGYNFFLKFEKCLWIFKGRKDWNILFCLVYSFLEIKFRKMKRRLGVKKWRLYQQVSFGWAFMLGAVFTHLKWWPISIVEFWAQNMKNLATKKLQRSRRVCDGPEKPGLKFLSPWRLEECR